MSAPVAVIVGAGDYIGAAIARRFAAGGFTVCLGRRNGDKLAPLVAEIEAEGGKILFAFILVDREEGGREALEARGIPVISLFTRTSLLG